MKSLDSRVVIATLARAAGGGIFTSEQAYDALGGDRRAVARRLSAFVRRGWLSRVRRGVYALRPLDAMPDRPVAQEDPWIVAAQVLSPCYIGGWSAAHHWSLSEQLFRKTFVVTTSPVRRADLTIGSSDFRLARRTKVTEGGLVTVWRDEVAVRVSSVEQTLLDGCTTPAWLGGGRQLFAVTRSAVELGVLDDHRLRHLLNDDVTGAALGRLGMLLEELFPSAELCLHFARSHRGTGYVRFDPSVSGRGRLVRRWGVWRNVAGSKDHS